MIIVDKNDLLDSHRDASGVGWKSLRLLVKSDGMGFSMTETTIQAGATLDLQYKNHIEACYCLAGTADITVVDTGVIHKLKSGVLYAPNEHEKHRVRVTSSEDVRLVCVFSPALQGDEVHGPDGSYPAT